jgi:hypothetical protein
MVFPLCFRAEIPYLFHALIGAAVLLASAAARGAGTEVSLGNADLMIYGARAYEEISDARFAGDLNGDGTSEILVGSEKAKVGTVSGAGRAFIVLGGSDLTPVVDLAIAGGRVTVIEHSSSGHADYLGHAVAPAGDLNGDGAPDILVSASRFLVSGRGEAGAVFVIFGGGSLPAAIDLAALGSGGIVIQGAKAGDLTGSSIAPAGDVDGDGLDDILIGAESADSIDRSNGGAVYVVFGSRSLPQVLDLAALGSAGLLIQGASACDGLGASVAGVSDVDGDGLADLVASAPGADPSSRKAAGEAYIVFGSRSFPESIDLAVLGSSGVRILGEKAGDGLGSAVASAGDFDGDGLPDVLIGSDLASPAGRNSAGKTYLIYGRSGMPQSIDLATLGAQGTVFDGVGGGDSSGHAVACAGDHDADGLADVLIGADKAQPHALGNAGQAYLVFGRSDRPASVDLAVLGAGGVTFDGEEAGDRSGHAVAGGGDVDGDGGTDLLVVAGRASTPLPPGGGCDDKRHQSGEAYVFIGAGAPPTPPVRDLACSASPGEVHLSWTAGGTYDAIRIERNGVLIAELPGGSTSCMDPSPPYGVVVYEVRGVRRGNPSLPARCEVSVLVRPPFGLICSVADGVVLLTWQHAAPADATIVSRDGAVIAELPGTATSFEDEAPPGVHEYRVADRIGSETSAPAVCIAAVPAPPVDLSCSADGTDVSLSWSLGSPLPSGIRISRDGEEIAVLDGSSTSYSDHGVPAGLHEYEVRALEGDGSSPAVSCTVRVLRPVEDLAGSSVAGDSTLTWTPGDDYESISVYRDGVEIAILDGAATGLVDPDLPPGTYEYAVVGLIEGASSEPAYVTVEVPAPVEDLACGADGLTASLSWRVPGPCDSILVVRDGALIATLAGTAASFIEELPGPGTYLYELTTVRGNGRSAPVACTVVAVPAPEGLECVLVSGTLLVSWNPGAGYDAMEVTVNGVVEPLLPGSASSASYDLGFIGSAHVEVRAIAGTSRSAAAVCEATEAEAPYGLSCLAQGLAVHLSWTVGADYDAVRIERDGEEIAVLSGGAVSFDDTVPGPGAYTYRVYGVIAGLDTLPAQCHLEVPGAPEDLACSFDGRTVSLGWTVPGSCDSIIVERNGETYAILPSAARTFIDPAPLPGTTVYGVRLSRLGSVGLAATCTVDVLDPPAGLACRAIGEAVELTWDAGPYTAIFLTRNGLAIGPPGGLPGDATSFLDDGLSPGLYAYEVRGVAGPGAASPSARCEVEAILFPIRLSCFSSDGEGVIRWVNPRAYDGIEVLRDGAVVGTLPGDATSFSEAGLVPGTYVYEVRGIAGGSVSSSSRCEMVVPEVPSDISCSQQGKAIRIEWTVSAPVESFSIRRDGSPLAVLSGDTSSFIDGAPPFGTHTYEVRGGAAGSWSVPATCAVLMIAPPRDLACVSEGASVRLTWTPGAAYEAIEVLRNGEPLATLAGDATSLIDPGLPPGVYRYEVRGIAGGDESERASCAAIVIAPVFSLECRAKGPAAEISWTSAAPYDAIDVCRKRPSDGDLVHVATLDGSATSWTDAGPGEDGETAYAIAGRIGGSPSARALCTVLRIPAPTALSCVVTNATVLRADVELSWSVPAGYDAVAIRRNGVLIASLGGGETAYADRGLGVGTYDYEVAGSWASGVSDPARCTVQVFLVTPPIFGLTCTIDGSEARLAWSVESGVDAIRIYRRAPGEATAAQIAELPGSTLSTIDRSATAAGDYRYEVSTVLGGIESAHVLCDVRKPLPPADLRCLPANLGPGTGDVQLTWTLPAPCDSITLLRDGLQVAVLPGDAALFVDPGLPVGTYAYRLSVLAGGSRSDLSAECVVTVPSLPPDPVDLSCSIENGTATLAWTLAAVYDSIEVRRKGPGDAAPAVIATLPGDAERFLDPGISRPGAYLYEVAGKLGALEALASCTTVLPVPPDVDPANCSSIEGLLDGSDVRISWVNGDDYDSIVVVRIRIAPLPTETRMVSLRGDQTSFLDRAVPDGEYDYAIVGVIGTGSSAAASCRVDIDRPRFIRSEVNGDGSQDIADPIYLLNYMFLGGPEPQCLEAADGNDDGEVDIADVLMVLQYQFYGGRMIPPPFPACGQDPTWDGIGCRSFPDCR